MLAEGAILATSEQDATTSEGYVGLWDATDGFGRIGETPAGGIGPHDLKRLPSGRVIVANGGIGTDPIDRTRLNLATMRPKLARLDPLGGGVVEVTELDPALLPLSIRHLALHPDGTVAFATQWEGDPEGLVPLLGLLALHGSNMLAEPLKPEARFMRGYAGSISWSGSGAEVAITSPTGGWAQRFDAAGRYLGTVTRPEVCGIAPLGPGFLLSDGLGGLVAVEDGTALPLGRAEVAWDTHLVAI